ncbi:hypothetical protein GQ597_11305 [Gilliamella sp. Pra-s65]|uniref:hypothetical protein n=1 Tax=unclassified Gilliamella TaxID=2685620 RepID=UPI00136649F4|nr:MULTISPECIES: hypothetical protein [unclassified Gilliamella]MWN91286.1 hypothetical protein [Gilliamella sp. Pra-s65]MWP74262.1 hypothetical protein [Gilliamella sp. Pra-s52]
MAKIVICSDDKSYVDAMLAALSEDHQVVFCDTTSSDYTEDFLSTFELIMDYRNSYEKKAGEPIKKCFDKGIPVIAGGNDYANGALLSLGISNQPSYSNGLYNSTVINNKDVISMNYNKKEISHYPPNNKSNWVYYIYNDNSTTPKK